MNEQIIAVDFDGTLCENKWPEIGEPNTNLIGYLIEMRKSFGAKIILWTCRVGEMLDKAVNWCSEHGLEFDAVNENLPHIVERFGGNTRKIFANMYIAKELGDVAWYLAVSAQALGFDLETILQMNVEKLKARYPHGFDAGHSQHRSSGDI